MTRTVTVDFAVPVEVAFTYLLEPRNRPEWQSSLAGIVPIDRGTPYVGMRWRDVTKVGVQPQMEITAIEQDRSWTERGTWRGIAAELTLHYEPTTAGCRVRAEFAITGRGPFRPLGPVLSFAGLSAVAPDLKRAAQILLDRGSAQ
ncbi:MAG: hypothetical protein JWQ74_3125 [Marmoricola sp.]|nr:hypothetical protein [Marmoricola sp.]